MDYLKNNLTFLKKHYPKLLEIAKENLYPDNKHIFTTKNNEPNMILNLSGREYCLHSKYNAKAEAQNWISTFRDGIGTTDAVLLFGMGLGYFLEELLEIPEVTCVYVIEPSIKVFNQIVRVRDVRPLLSNSKIKMLAVGSDELFIHEVTNQISAYLSSANLMITATPIYRKMFDIVFGEFSKKMKESLIDQIANFHTIQTFQDQWLSNVLNNLPFTLLYPSVAELNNVWEGISAIVVGSGPSLQKDIHFLKQLTKKCLIIAAGSSIQALQYHGIQPHLLVSIDGGEANVRVFENIDTSSVPLLFITQIHHEILNQYKGEMLFSIFGNDLISDYFLSDTPIPHFLNTSTVTGTAIQVARYLGAKEIILMGQDLSYPDNQYYSQGINHISAESRNSTLKQAEANKLVVPNVDGGFNPTTQKMLVTLEDMELLIKLVGLDGVKFVNSSRGGAEIKGTEYIPMDQLFVRLQKLPDIDISIPDRLTYPTEKFKSEMYNLIVSKMRYMINQSEKVKNRVEEILAVFDDLALCQTKKNKGGLKKVLIRINDLWGHITTTETFTVFFAFSRVHHLNVYKRYIAKIVETKDPFEKASLLSEHLKKLVKVLNEFIPEMQGNLKISLQKMYSFSKQIRGEADERSI